MWELTRDTPGRSESDKNLPNGPVASVSRTGCSVGMLSRATAVRAHRGLRRIRALPALMLGLN